MTESLAGIFDRAAIDAGIETALAAGSARANA